jgi:hypothetical protein
VHAGAPGLACFFHLSPGLRFPPTRILATDGSTAAPFQQAVAI